MSNAPYPWHDAQWARVQRAREQARVPHAWLLHGAAGTGKRDFAEHLAKALLCTAEAGPWPCGDCRSCALARAGTHPDYVHIGIPEDKREIPVDLVRGAVDQATLTRSIGAFKTLIVAPAEAANDNAASALLKTLEEPPAATVFILVSDRPAALLATIRSRCQRLEMPVASLSQALAWLAQEGHADADRATELLDAAGGAPLRARELGDDPALLSLRQEMRGQLSDLLRGRVDPVAVAASWAKAPLDEVLTWMLSLTTGLVRRRVTESAESASLAALDPVGLYAILDEVIQARRAVAGRANLNATLLLESLAVAWAYRGLLPERAPPLSRAGRP